MKATSPYLNRPTRSEAEIKAIAAAELARRLAYIADKARELEDDIIAMTGRKMTRIDRDKLLHRLQGIVGLTR